MNVFGDRKKSRHLFTKIMRMLMQVVVFLVLIFQVKTDTEDVPVEAVVITNCGEMPTEEFNFYPDDENIWGWIKAASPALGSSFIVLGIFHYFYRQLDMYC